MRSNLELLIGVKCKIVTLVIKKKKTGYKNLTKV